MGNFCNNSKGSYPDEWKTIEREVDDKWNSQSNEGSCFTAEEGIMIIEKEKVLQLWKEYIIQNKRGEKPIMHKCIEWPKIGKIWKKKSNRQDEAKQLVKILS